MIQFISEHYVQVLELLGLLFASGGVLEVIVRLTPTKSDDGFADRVAAIVDKLMSALKIPNRLKKPDDSAAD